MSFEEKMYYAVRNIRDPLLKPIIKTFILLGFSPAWVSYLGIISMLLCIFCMRSNLYLSLIFLGLALLMDVLDGCLARALHVASDRGKFIDVLVDNINFTIFSIGLLNVFLVSPLTTVLYVYCMLLVKILMILKKNITKKTDWIIKPMVGAYPNIFVYSSYSLFALYVLGDINYLETASFIFTLLLIIKALTDYSLITTTVFEA